MGNNRLIIRSFQLDKLIDKQIYDFIPNIENNITFQGMYETEILARWENYFKAKNVPYIITREGKEVKCKGYVALKYRLRLWKELIANDSRRPTPSVMFDGQGPIG